MDEEKNNFDQNQQTEATDIPEEEEEKKLGENNVPTQPSPQDQNQVSSESYENPYSVKDNSQYNQNLEEQKTEQAQTQYQAPQGQYQQPGQVPQGQYQAPQGQYQQPGQRPQGQYQAPQGQAGQYQQAGQRPQGQYQAPQGQYQQPGQAPQGPQGQGPYSQYGQQPAPGKKADGLAITSLVLGILGILGSILTWFAFIGTILGIVGLILAIISRKNNGKTSISTGGLITSIVAIILTLIVTISCYACSCFGKKAFDDLGGYEYWEEFEDYDWEKEFENWD